MSLAAYRHVMRSARIAFQGDTSVLLAAKSQIRTEFRQNAALVDAKAIQDAILKAEDVSKILRENVVQGKKQDDKDHTYELRIHEYTERGDNESIKTAGQRKATGSGCCQSA
ncbi:complex III assembly factor LYRM7 [Geosmithia morbida]|uniref:Mitochondrial zinc maintenance protein 1, mitochondrial n=1 Tax=Geosmithia morbida TaxID=1094350 RepID=A0A9P5D0H6_9HYPO|nr:complex III assembly factor LYRM7 [Geosmithia morbida]KAF4119461.1 complex III assembly factor LYRM7 [Geosmithia morbida]